MRKWRQKILDDAISRQKSQSLSLVNGSGNSELLPIDLIIEILLRLPVKSIARCRCVSKLWSWTILRPDFTNLVMKRSATTQPQLLLACKRQSEVLFYSSPQPQNANEKSSRVVAANYHMNFTLSCGYYVLNSVHGLVCLQNVNAKKDKVLVICNPSTGQSLTLPKVKTKRVDVKSFFGYDAVGKQFKLLCMTIPIYGRDTFVISGEHQVLTLVNGKLSWRMIECNIPHYPLFGDGICINGVLYYQAKVNGFEEKDGILSFDIRPEKFKLIGEEKKDGRPALVNYKGQLATLRSDNCCHAVCETSRSIELCVLEDAQKHEWSTYTYVLPLLSTYIASPYGMTIEGVTRTGEIVLSSHHQSRPFYFLYYNFERKTIKKVEVQGMDMSGYHKIHTFIDHVEDVKIGEVFQTS